MAYSNEFKEAVIHCFYQKQDALKQMCKDGKFKSAQKAFYMTFLPQLATQFECNIPARTTLFTWLTESENQQSVQQETNDLGKDEGYVTEKSSHQKLIIKADNPQKDITLLDQSQPKEPKIRVVLSNPKHHKLENNNKLNSRAITKTKEKSNKQVYLPNPPLEQLNWLSPFMFLLASFLSLIRLCLLACSKLNHALGTWLLKLARWI